MKQSRIAANDTASPLPYRIYNVWDAPTRWFHWINALAVFGLSGIGVMLICDDAIGLSLNGKVLVKQVHVGLGYIMATNLAWRFVWAFFGNRHARWHAMLPYGSGYWGSLRAYANAFVAGEPQQYVGHNPAARIGIALLLLLLVVQSATGLVLAGTDLFWPPFGRWFANWVAATGLDPGTVSPLASNTIDEAAYKAMRAFRSPFGIIHLYGFYALSGVVVAHLVGVIMTEIREGGSITSAMFSGRKILNRPPQDS